MGRACCVLGCPSKGDAPSHLIPKNPTLFQKWKKQIYSSKIQHLTDEQMKKRAVCYRYFARDDYLSTFRSRKLKPGIVPSLNLPNRPATDEPDIRQVDIKQEMKVRNTDTSASAEELGETVTKERTDVALLEDIPEEIKSRLFEQPTPEATIDKHVKQHNFTRKRFKLYCRKRLPERRRANLTEKQLMLLQHRKQVEQYEQTPTIQKLLSTLTSIEVASIKAKIQRSKYSPRICVRVYHNMAKRKALYQS